MTWVHSADPAGWVGISLLSPPSTGASPEDDHSVKKDDPPWTKKDPDVNQGYKSNYAPYEDNQTNSQG